MILIHYDLADSCRQPRSSNQLNEIASCLNIVLYAGRRYIYIYIVIHWTDVAVENIQTLLYIIK